MGMSDEQMAQRGRDAVRILQDPIMVDAFGAVRERLLAIMEVCKTDEATLKAKLALGLLADVKAHVEMVAKNGIVAAQTIEMDEARKASEEKRKWWRPAA